jgi:hypothetical protein
MTLDDHLATELTDILSSVTDLTVKTSDVGNSIVPPLARLFALGERPLSDHGELHTRRVQSEYMMTVYITGDGEADALNQARNEYKEAIEYALQTHQIAAYDGTRYAADGPFIIDIGDASGVFDDMNGQSSFVLRFSVNYYKQVK